MQYFRYMSAVVALLAAVTLAAKSAVAMSVTPIHVEMTSTGAASRAQITVTNDGPRPLPVEIAIQRMEMTEDGNRKLSMANNEFLAFPPQAIVAPGQTQTFRLQWVGEPDLQYSQSFLITANQIPVKLPADKSAVQIVMSFGVIVNVAPPKGTGSLAIVGTGVQADAKSGKRQATLTVQNSSKVHALLPDGVLRLSSGSWSHTFSPAEMREKIGIGLVQPGKRRKFVLPVDLPPNVTKVEATLDYRPKRN